MKEEKNTTGMLVKICQEHGMGYPTESDLKNVRTMITYIKNMMLNDKEIQKLEEESDIRIRGIYQAYCSQMREKKWMDYDDQMLYAYENAAYGQQTSGTFSESVSIYLRG